MIFGHFIYFGHFPIEIPIEAEKIYHHGKELSYRENKMCSETSEVVGTIWEHAQKEFQKFLKISITLPRGSLLDTPAWMAHDGLTLYGSDPGFKTLFPSP